jgi:hypothetical protein
MQPWNSKSFTHTLLNEITQLLVSPKNGKLNKWRTQLLVSPVILATSRDSSVRDASTSRMKKKNILSPFPFLAAGFPEPCGQPQVSWTCVRYASQNYYAFKNWERAGSSTKHVFFKFSDVYGAQARNAFVWNGQIKWKMLLDYILQKRNQNN